MGVRRGIGWVGRRAGRLDGRGGRRLAVSRRTRRDRARRGRRLPRPRRGDSSARRAGFPRTGQTARSLSIQDRGPHFRVAVGDRATTLDDPARDCAARAREAAVVVGERASVAPTGRRPAAVDDREGGGVRRRAREPTVPPGRRAPSFAARWAAALGRWSAPRARAVPATLSFPGGWKAELLRFPLDAGARATAVLGPLSSLARARRVTDADGDPGTGGRANRPAVAARRGCAGDGGRHAARRQAHRRRGCAQPALATAPVSVAGRAARNGGRDAGLVARACR